MLTVLGVAVSRAELCVKLLFAVILMAYGALYVGIYVALLRRAVRPGRLVSENARGLLGLGDRAHGIVETVEEAGRRGKTRVNEQEKKSA
jgi:hypothetical protein